MKPPRDRAGAEQVLERSSASSWCYWDYWEAFELVSALLGPWPRRAGSKAALSAGHKKFRVAGNAHRYDKMNYFSGSDCRDLLQEVPI